MGKRDLVVDHFREICQNLRLNDKKLRDSWYNIKNKEYSEKQRIKLSILRFWYFKGATPDNYFGMYQDYKEICDTLCVKRVDTVGSMLIDLYIRFIDYAFSEQFKDCLKYYDGSLRLYKLNLSGKIAFKTNGGEFIDFLSREVINLPEQCFSVCGLAVSDVGIFVPVKHHM